MNLVRLVLRLAALTSVAVLVGACASTSSPLARAKRADLSGEWVLVTESQVGAEEARMTVRQTGNALTGTITGQAGATDYTGSVKGSSVEFDYIIKVRGTDLKLDYTGTVEGDTMKGKAVFGQFGEGTFTAKRR
jgi:hypothetical protein